MRSRRKPQSSVWACGRALGCRWALAGALGAPLWSSVLESRHCHLWPPSFAEQVCRKCLGPPSLLAGRMSGSLYMGCVWGGVPGTEPTPRTNRPVLEGSTGNPGALWRLGLGLGSGPSAVSVPSWNLEEEGLAGERSWPGQTLSWRDACPGRCWVGEGCSGASLPLAHSNSEKLCALGRGRRIQAAPQMGPGGCRERTRPSGS